MRIAVYTVTRGKLDLCQQSFKLLKRYAGCEFDHYVADNGSDVGPWLTKRKYRFARVLRFSENMGQNIAANALLDEIDLAQYDFVVRWDPDALPRTRRFLRKLARTAVNIGEPCVLSPKITKLKHEPPTIATAKAGDRSLEVVGILGGICRLHPSRFFDGWRFNRYGALGFGEAAEVADRCTDLRVGMARVCGIEVEHAHGEDKQAKLYPEQFGWQKEVARYVGYGL